MTCFFLISCRSFHWTAVKYFKRRCGPKLGYRKATDIACVVGMVGACLLAVYGLYQWQSSGVMLIAIAVVGFLYCRSRRMILRETGDEYSSDDGIDYSASLAPTRPASAAAQADG